MHQGFELIALLVELFLQLQALQIASEGMADRKSASAHLLFEIRSPIEAWREFGAKGTKNQSSILKRVPAALFTGLPEFRIHIRCRQGAAR